MQKVIFFKYSVYGNNFIFVDEIKRIRVEEAKKAFFSQIALNNYYGIGGDNVLFLQRYSKKLLNEINVEHNYWEEIPSYLDSPELIFRMYETDGREALCCGNGLMCMAYHIHSFYGLNSSNITTEIPSISPQVRNIRWFKKNYYEVNLGYPARIPSLFVNNVKTRQIFTGIDQIEISVKSERNAFEITGFLTYTGEPHLVFFETPNNIDLFRRLFDTNLEDFKERSSLVIRDIGLMLNYQKSLFPNGINVNFARIIDKKSGLIEYRCFERGILKETLACGTGALAIASIAHQLGKVKVDRINIIPFRSRWEKPYQMAVLQTSKNSDGSWRIMGSPHLSFRGAIEI
jgi:diaminopimelate epimerase